jgi:simple sugar transport system ATP-binding protein
MKIELRHVHKHFGSVHANNDISVIFPAGHIVGVLGENGAGKSTLMKILSGYQPADSGTILLDDRVVHYDNPQEAIAHGIGMLQQDPLDIPAFTVLENFMYGFPGGLRLDRRRARQTLLSTCASAGFTLDPDMAIDQLTIGQRQQLEIVRQLALGVRALILDEPTTGISAEQKQTLFDALRHLAHDKGMSILLVSHKLEDVIALCDDVIVLRGGRLVGQASMPVTTAELVRMMFGQELAPPAVSRQQPGKPILELDQVSLRGQRVHIDRYSLRVSEREIIGLAGLDGSGQDLILRACAGLVRPTHGHVRLNGTDMTGKSFRDFMARGVAFSAAGRLEEGLIAGLTLTEHMALVNGRSALIHWGAVRQITATQLTTYNVRGRPESRIEALSGGNQQRMLMALMPRRPVLMALEHPTRGLDVDSTRWIWEQLLERRDQGTAILFTSPDLDEIVTYSDRILVLFAGRVFEVADARRTTIDELGRLIGGHFEAVEPTPGRM